VEKVAVAKGEKILTRLGQVVCPLHYVRFVVNTGLGEKLTNYEILELFHRLKNLNSL
jgi:hypothetical protein